MKGVTEMSSQPFVRRVPVAGLAPDGDAFRILADEPSRAAVASALGLLALPAFEGRFRLAPDGRGGARLDGVVEAEVVQACVVTLEPVAGRVSEPVSLRFAPEAARRADAVDVDVDLAAEDDDPPEPIVGGQIDLGAVMVEFLALGLDPYPRAPGAAFEASTEREQPEHPFARLAALKGSGP
jgi:hypothetical protein